MQQDRDEEEDCCDAGSEPAFGSRPLRVPILVVVEALGEPPQQKKEDGEPAPVDSDIDAEDAADLECVHTSSNAFPCVLSFRRINAFQPEQVPPVGRSSQVTKRLLECSLTKYIATAYKLRTAK